MCQDSNIFKKKGWTSKEKQISFISSLIKKKKILYFKYNKYVIISAHWRSHNKYWHSDYSFLKRYWWYNDGENQNKNCDFTWSNINVYMEVIGPSRVHFATNKMILTKVNLDKHIMCTTLIKRSLILSWNKWKKFLTLKGQHKNLCF